MIVMQACCNKDCDELIGQWRVGRNGTTYRMGKMQISDIIVLARELMIHGVIGKVKIRKLQRNEGKKNLQIASMLSNILPPPALTLA